jgi:hypothetical protein
MKKVQISSAPDWAAIFAKRPDLEAPGYQEILAQVRSKQPDYEAQRIREKMQQIHKEKTSAKNRNKNRKK